MYVTKQAINSITPNVNLVGTCSEGKMKTMKWVFWWETQGHKTIESDTENLSEPSTRTRNG